MNTCFEFTWGGKLFSEDFYGNWMKAKSFFFITLKFSRLFNLNLISSPLLMKNLFREWKRNIRVAREFRGWRGTTRIMNESLKASTKGGKWSESLSWKMRCRTERRKEKRNTTTVTLTTRDFVCGLIMSPMLRGYVKETEVSHKIGFVSASSLVKTETNLNVRFLTLIFK